ncbi:non-homologous end-joining DNA ligase [Actinoplanes sp. LDG1-06]|uniref:DNA ligase (ATP) n=1 Tax=Paractinoplanes ovalisporus TaxID=2810368 RepID=A0ABS2ALA9_9ACTN|nr:non-homologous end-joining DNA ligase [Actinoplanes ovalisporus]MBM2620570.1 non-homologous end-joining DNA ligase [Actinoplanes ovalisporus]
MLAAAGPLPGGPGWAFEFKYDGVRAITEVCGGRIEARSRNLNDITASYPELGELPGLLNGRDAILDGEIVALEGDRPSFALLQQRMHVDTPSQALIGAVPVLYYVFDLLGLDGEDLTPQPYATRRDLLSGLGLVGAHVRVPARFTEADGRTVLRAAELAGLEGVVAKRLASPYRTGKRSSDWTKIPLVKTQEVLVIGWKAGSGRRSGTIGSLLLAVYDNADRLVFAGHVGTGFSDSALRHLQTELAALSRRTPPIEGVPREYARVAHWVEPALIGEVAFRNWTPDGRLRHPSWRGLRTDRSPASIRRAPEPVPPPSQGTVIGAMQTPDGRWRVEAVRRGRQDFYRIIHGDNVIDGLAIATVERLLGEAGVNLGDLIEGAA